MKLFVHISYNIIIFLPPFILYSHTLKVQLHMEFLPILFEHLCSLFQLLSSLLYDYYYIQSLVYIYIIDTIAYHSRYFAYNNHFVFTHPIPSLIAIISIWVHSTLLSYHIIIWSINIFVVTHLSDKLLLLLKQSVST